MLPGSQYALRVRNGRCILYREPDYASVNVISHCDILSLTSFTLRPVLPRHERTPVPLPPAPWHADKMPGGYIVRDASGQALVFAEARQAKVLARMRRGGSR